MIEDYKNWGRSFDAKAYGISCDFCYYPTKVVWMSDDIPIERALEAKGWKIITDGKTNLHMCPACAAEEQLSNED